MDDPRCDRMELNNTYRQFSIINSLISRWKYIFETEIKPRCTKTNRSYRLLDIGFGGGDIPLKIAQWAAKNKICLQVTGIEIDKRAYTFARSLEVPDNISYRLQSTSDLLHQNEQFDFVISNHLIHHLNHHSLQKLLYEARQLSTKAVLFNDIERSDIGYALFNLLSRPVFRSSFITADGLTSIKRSYTPEELRQAIPDDWQVMRIFPYRLLLSYYHD